MILTTFTESDVRTLIKFVNLVAFIQEYRQIEEPSVLRTKQFSTNVKQLYSTRDCFNEIILMRASFFKEVNKVDKNEAAYNRFLGCCRIITNFSETARLMKDLHWTSWSPAFYRRLAFVAGTALIILFGKESLDNYKKIKEGEKNKDIDRQEYLLKLIRSLSRCNLGVTLIRHSITQESYQGHMLMAMAGDVIPSCLLLFKEKMAQAK